VFLFNFLIFIATRIVLCFFYVYISLFLVCFCSACMHSKQLCCIAVSHCTAVLGGVRQQSGNWRRGRNWGPSKWAVQWDGRRSADITIASWSIHFWAIHTQNISPGKVICPVHCFEGLLNGDRLIGASLRKRWRIIYRSEYGYTRTKVIISCVLPHQGRLLWDEHTATMETGVLQLQVRSCGAAFQLNCDKLTLAFNNLSGY